MKEKLYNIPMNDAVNAQDECPFCYIERDLEQNALDFVLGSSSSYMESDIREQTDAAGFCRKHFKLMFDYGNALGNALILKTHYAKIRKELEEQKKSFAPQKKSLFQKIRRSPAGGGEEHTNVGAWTAKRDCSCYICKGLEENFGRYLSTFFSMYQKDEDFRARVEKSKGFCLHHFGILCDAAGQYLNDRQMEEFYSMAFRLMEENLARIEEDVSWMVDMFDYRNKNADWKNSRDALQRGMQKLRGGYPADPVYHSK